MRYLIMRPIALGLCLMPLAAATPGFKQWLNDALPVKGQTLQEEIKCYSLPYGWIGLASHILTYYTVVILCFGNSPWIPWKPLKHWKIDLFLTVIGLALTICITVFTMVRCRSRWLFVLIAFWKLMLSLALSGTSFHILIKIWSSKKRTIDDGSSRPPLEETGIGGHTEEHRAPTDPTEQAAVAGGTTSQGREQRRDKTARRIAIKEGATFWVVLHLVGTTIGYIGLFRIVKQSWENLAIRALVYEFLGFIAVFAGASLAGFAFFVITSDSNKGTDKKELAEEISIGVSFMIPLILVLVFELVGVFFSDWVLGAIAGNFSGIPDGNNAVLFWVYFAAKRLPFVGF